ncbi:hypothetical protein EJ04DRAFT_491586 [Polyplosphaeria fusca]|uniref:U1-C C2H2-type zinc finger domain-containing protein n=1 Tax=Polyplosphaeria fusca TaxID=682080 RepID=A0A9P4QX03_9PLEO|nr:hypothetical protein EJ04DRAFT_491586 [Polyplosphaeria fusca]
MAEYWKSTPKYWCKFCSVYVRETKRDRTEHEATGRHQGNVQRSLRGIHKDQQRQEREKTAAQREVARLNGLVPNSASPTAPAISTPASPKQPPVPGKLHYTKTQEKTATLQDRKKQWEQLAALGVAVPEQARGDMAIAGEWQVVSQRVIGEDGKEIKPSGLSTGVHKRKLDEDEEEQQAAGEIIKKKKGWGHSLKSFPGKSGADNDDDDIEALFKKTKRTPEVKREPKIEDKQAVKQEEGQEDALQEIPTVEEAARRGFTKVTNTTTSGLSPDVGVSIKKEDGDVAVPTVVFKKRKKIMR